MPFHSSQSRVVGVNLALTVLPRLKLFGSSQLVQGIFAIIIRNQWSLHDRWAKRPILPAPAHSRRWVSAPKYPAYPARAWRGGTVDGNLRLSRPSCSGERRGSTKCSGLIGRWFARESVGMELPNMPNRKLETEDVDHFMPLLKLNAGSLAGWLAG